MAWLATPLLGDLGLLFLAEFGQPHQFVAFGFDRGFFFFQLLLLGPQICFTVDQPFQLPIDQRFAFRQALFKVGQFPPPRAERLFRLFAEFEGFFVGREPRLARYGFRLTTGGLDQRFVLRSARGIEPSLFVMEKPVTEQNAREEKRSSFPK